MPLVTFLIILLGLLLSAVFFSGLTRFFVLASLGAVLVGGIALVYLNVRQGGPRLLQIVRLYLRQLEQIHADFVSRKTFDKQVSDLASFLFNELGLSRVALFARKKQGFVPIGIHGIQSKETLRSLKFGGRDPLIQAMESRRASVILAKLYGGSKEGALLLDFAFEEALPVFSSGKASHFILVSGSKVYPMRLLRPFLLALADQVGNYSHLDEQQQKHNQMIQKLRTQLVSLKDQNDRLVATPTFDARAMIAAQDKLLRIHDRDQLYLTLVQLIEEQFAVDFAAIFVPGSDGVEYTMKYQHQAPPSLENAFGLTAESPLFSQLRSTTGCVRMEKLNETQGKRQVIETLSAAGTSALALLTDADGRESLLGIGRRGRSFTAEELDAVSSHCRLFSLVLESLNHFEQIEQMSYTDSMTGLYNYRYFYKRLQEEMLRAERFGRHLALAIFDIDEFKVFNDTYGHQSGDYLLEQLGALLRKSVRSIDVVSRYGGEEFCVIMPETSAEDCAYFMDRMRVTVSNQEFKGKFSDDDHRVTISLGGAIYPNDAQRIDRLIYCADMALLQAKGSGKNKSCMFNEQLLSDKK